MKFTMNELEWTIKEVPQSHFLSYEEGKEDEYTFGETHFPTQEIWICEDLVPTQKKRTLLHELMHCYIGCYIATELEDVDQEFICEISANSHDRLHTIVEEYMSNYVHKTKKPTKRKTVLNMAKCLKCGDIIESRHTHDYVVCSCGNLAVDGGKDYCKRNFRDGENSWIDLSQTVESEEDFDGKTI